jgi:hypothetical protein
LGRGVNTQVPAPPKVRSKRVLVASNLDDGYEGRQQRLSGNASRRRPRPTTEERRAIAPCAPPAAKRQPPSRRPGCAGPFPPRRRPTRRGAAAPAKALTSPSARFRVSRLQCREPHADANSLQHREPSASLARKFLFSAHETWSNGAGRVMTGPRSPRAVLARADSSTEARGNECPRRPAAERATTRLQGRRRGQYGPRRRPSR